MMKYSFVDHHLQACDGQCLQYLVAIDHLDRSHDQDHRNERMVRIKKEKDHLLIDVMIPSDTLEQPPTLIGFDIHQDHVIIMDDQDHALAWLNHIANDHYFMVQPFPLDIVCLLLEVAMSEDVIFFSTIQQHFEQMEESLFTQGSSINFDHRLSHYKRIIHRFNYYYLQLNDLLYTLKSDQTSGNGSIDQRLVDRLIDRITLLRSESELLNDYCHQVQGVHHNMIEQRQNEIMKVLTIVTTVFLPLSLLASWYGMNFINMPELSWSFGYPMVIIIGIIVTSLILIIFKKHHLL